MRSVLLRAARGGIADRRLGTCHRTRKARAARAASTDAPAGVWPPLRRPWPPSLRRLAPMMVAALCAAASTAGAQTPVGLALASALARSSDSIASAGAAAAAVPAGPRLDALAPSFTDSAATAKADTGERRPRAVEYSDAYYTRLTIHRYGSYAMLPLFAVEYALGQRILSGQQTGDFASPGTVDAHRVVAGTIGVLFAVNTVTGVWNLIEARKDPVGRTRRNIHALGMLLADAGFLYTASLAGDAHEGENVTSHRNAAIASIGVATVSGVMMWLWRE